MWNCQFLTKSRTSNQRLWGDHDAWTLFAHFRYRNASSDGPSNWKKRRVFIRMWARPGHRTDGHLITSYWCSIIILLNESSIISYNFMAAGWLWVLKTWLVGGNRLYRNFAKTNEMHILRTATDIKKKRQLIL